MNEESAAFGPVGLDEQEELVYRSLLRAGHLSAAELAREVGAAASKVTGLLEGLETRGFVSRVPGRPSTFVAAPPEVAIEAAISRQLEGIERARSAARRLAEDARMPGKRAPLEVVEVVLGGEAVLQRWAQLQQIASSELLAFDRPPYSRPVPDVNADEDVALRRGVTYRIVYSRAAIEWPNMLDHIRRYVRAGELARVLQEVPMKLDIVDRKLALLPLTSEDPGRVDAALLLHDSPLLETLVELFELLWSRAVPLGHALVEGQAATAASPEEHREVLALLAAGLKDEGIARQLGVSLRTVRRRIAALLEELGARTRYQAGLQAARRGWYGPSREAPPPGRGPGGRVPSGS